MQNKRLFFFNRVYFRFGGLTTPHLLNKENKQPLFGCVYTMTNWQNTTYDSHNLTCVTFWVIHIRYIVITTCKCNDVWSRDLLRKRWKESELFLFFFVNCWDCFWDCLVGCGSWNKVNSFIRNSTNPRPSNFYGDLTDIFQFH